MKQSIIVPQRLSPTVFNLPCVDSAMKSGIDGTYYHLISWYMADDYQPLFAHPGDTLIEEDDGKWRVEKSHQKKIKS